jgi:predicted MFS family arabinose efflux permease
MGNPANRNVMGALTGAMKDLAGIFREPGLSSAAWSMLFSRMGTGAYGAFIPLFLIHRLSFGDEDIAWFLSLFGLGSGVAFLLVYPWLSSRFNVRRITTASLWGALAAIAVSLLCRERYLAWLFPVPISIFLSLAYGGIMGVMADAAGEERRGWIFGIAASLDSLALGLGVMLCGLVEAKSESGSMVISLLFFVLAPLVASRLPLPAAKTTIGKGEEPCRSDL